VQDKTFYGCEILIYWDIISCNRLVRG